MARLAAPIGPEPHMLPRLLVEAFEDMFDVYRKRQSGCLLLDAVMNNPRRRDSRSAATSLHVASHVSVPLIPDTRIAPTAPFPLRPVRVPCQRTSLYHPTLNQSVVGYVTSRPWYAFPVRTERTQVYSSQEAATCVLAVY